MFRGFNDLDDARGFNSRYLSPFFQSPFPSYKFSAIGKPPSGRGKNAILTVEKNKIYYQNEYKFYEKMRKYADDLRRNVKTIYDEELKQQENSSSLSLNNLKNEGRSVNNPKKKKKISSIDLTSL